MNAADQFKKQVDYGLMTKMNKIKTYDDNAHAQHHGIGSIGAADNKDKDKDKRKAGSVNRIKDPKYM